MECMKVTGKNLEKKHLVKGIILMLMALGMLVLAAESVKADDGTVSVYNSTVIKEGSMRMIAHRGYSAVAPENTLPSYIAAGKSSFWGAECDIHRTKDGAWILMHDDTDNAETYYKRGVTAITTNCLTQEKPQLTVWQKTVWAIKNFFAGIFNK